MLIRSESFVIVMINLADFEVRIIVALFIESCGNRVNAIAQMKQKTEFIETRGGIPENVHEMNG